MGRARGPALRPGYWESCRKMGFGELAGFIRVCLREPPGFGRGPKTRGELEELLGMLARKAGLAWERGDGEEVWERGDRERHRKLLAELDRARRSLRIAEDAARRDPRLRGQSTKKVRKERRNVWDTEREIVRLEREAGRYGNEGQEPPAEAPAEGETKRQAKARRRAERRRELAPRRRVVAGIARDIEAVFPASAAPAAASRMGRLPWRVLPPGELTLERVLAHHRRLARERPGGRLDPERIEKAHSLGPSMWWEGLGGFDGYVVFEYPDTDRVLLESGLHGNAIYVLGPDWQRLSRLSKREVLKDPSTRRIVHRGEWFARVKAALGIR